LQVSISKISRMETGARAVSGADIEALSALYELDPEARSALQEIASQGRRRRRPAPQPDAMQTDDVVLAQSGFLELERDAVRIREFNGDVVPGLLQSEDYMRAVMVEATPDIDDALVRRAMTQRRARQRILGADQLYEVIVDEPALLRVVGGAQVMADQLAAIRERLASGRVSFKVIPLERGAHPGLNSMFVALAMGRDDVPDMVFVEGLAGHVRLEKAEDVERFDRVWGQLSDLAESTSQTAERLAQLEADFTRGASRPPATLSGN
jgi:hypothetical protein